MGKALIAEFLIEFKSDLASLSLRVLASLEMIGRKISPIVEMTKKSKLRRKLPTRYRYFI